MIFAVLRSWLQHRGFAVTLVENITDVDDKIINKANAEGRSPAEVAAEYTATYLQDTERLGIPRPDLEPKATETIPEIIDLVCQLVAQGHAYEAQGSVYFRVRSFAGYGKLSRQRIEELEEGVRVEAEPGKQDPLDFAVWKAAKPGEPAWESPWGMGRPGWHIECSAMGLRYLGPGFDIHGGGRDLIFPHHENEVAQSEAAGLPFARLWMHNGMIRTAGAKMAKSVGNIFLLREVLDVYPRAGGAHVLPHHALPQPARVLAREAGRGQGGLRASGRRRRHGSVQGRDGRLGDRHRRERPPGGCRRAGAVGLRRAHGRRPEHGRRHR